MNEKRRIVARAYPEQQRPEVDRVTFEVAGALVTELQEWQPCEAIRLERAGDYWNLVITTDLAYARHVDKLESERDTFTTTVEGAEAHARLHPDL